MRRWRVELSSQTIVGVAVAAIAAVLVLYPIYFLFQAALNVGDPEAKPPTDYGFENFLALGRYWQILLNTLTVSLYDAGTNAAGNRVLAFEAASAGQTVLKHGLAEIRP